MIIQNLVDRSHYLVSKLEDLTKEELDFSERKSAELSYLQDLEKAQDLLKKVVRDTQNELSLNLSAIASTALDSIFPGTEFKLRFIEKRKGVECEFILLDADKNEITDPLLSRGGGVTDVLSFTLRISCLLLSKKSRILILDEVFRFLSTDLQLHIGSLISDLSTKLGIQFIFITHEEIITQGIDIGEIRDITELKEERE